MICVVNLTGCRDRKSQEQTELISLDGREPDVEKADGNTEKEAEGSEAGTDDNMTEKDSLKQEKLQICYVHVCGAVKSPGVYELTSDSRLYEAIQMAGGFTDEAAGEALNQAEKIEDGSRIYVPTKEEAKAGTENNGTFVQNADNEKRTELTEEYRERFANPFRAAELGYIDEVILPEQTRAKLIAALEMAQNKNVSNPPKKHGNMPL